MSDNGFLLYKADNITRGNLTAADLSILILALDCLSLDRTYSAEYGPEAASLGRKLRALEARSWTASD